MPLDVSKYSLAGGASPQALQYGGSPQSALSGNPFKPQTQEHGEYEQRYASLPQSQGGALPDYTYLARQQLELQKEANAPAVSSYQASLPEISQKYAQERT